MQCIARVFQRQLILVIDDENSQLKNAVAEKRVTVFTGRQNEFALCYDNHTLYTQ